ncbi:MAG: MaoC/PaaZ C-terminal domain-containing protein [Burkholderiaceae bacterium]
MTDPLPAVLETRALVASADAIRTYAELTGDTNPIHLDPVFAATTPMGGVIAHGTMSLSLLWESLACTVGPERIARTTLDVRFLAPVRVGEHITVGGTQRADTPGCFDVWARTAAAVVIEGVARIRPA